MGSLTLKAASNKLARLEPGDQVWMIPQSSPPELLMMAAPLSQLNVRLRGRKLNLVY